MAFPIAPSVNQVYTTPNGASYKWDGEIWVPVSNGAAAGGTPTGTPFTFAGFDTGGSLYTIPSWTFDSVNFGAEVYLTVNPLNNGGATYPNLHTFGMTVDPLVNNSDENWSAISMNVNIDPNVTSNDIDAYITGYNDYMSYNASGHIDQLFLRNASMNIGQSGGGENPDLDNLYAYNLGINFYDGTIDNAFVDNAYASFDNSTVTNINLVQRNFTVLDGNSDNATLNNVSVNIDNSTITSNLQLNNGGITLQNAASVNNLSLINHYVNINDTSTIANLTLGQLNASGIGTVTNVNGFQIDVSGVDSPNRKQAGGFNGGTMFINGDFTTTNSVPFDQGHLIGGNLTIESGSPITGTAFIFNNLASNIVLNDDMDSGILDLGFTPVGFVGQFTGTTGNTVDRINMASSGMAIAAGSTGGNVTDWVGYHSIGVANFGGVIDSVTNVMAFSTKNSTFGTVGTNVWGVYIPQSNADNWFKKSVTIGGTTGQTADSFVGLDIAEPKTIQAGSFTTAERTAIVTAAGGNLVYDEDFEAFYFTDNAGAWQAFGGGVANNLFTADLTLGADRLHDMSGGSGGYTMGFTLNGGETVTIGGTSSGFFGSPVPLKATFTGFNAEYTSLGFIAEHTSGTLLEAINDGGSGSRVVVSDGGSNESTLQSDGNIIATTSYRYPAWKALTLYDENTIVYVNYLGRDILIKRIFGGTSGATFDATEYTDWTNMSGDEVTPTSYTLDFVSGGYKYKANTDAVLLDYVGCALGDTGYATMDSVTNTDVRIRDEDFLQTSTFALDGANTFNSAMTFDGTLIWCLDLPTGDVFGYDLTGTLITQFSTSGEVGGAGARGIAFDGTNLWVSDEGTGIMYEYTTAGAYTANSINVSALVNQPHVQYFDGNNFVVVGGDVTDPSSLFIFQIDSTGALVSKQNSPYFYVTDPNVSLDFNGTNAVWFGGVNPPTGTAEIVTTFDLSYQSTITATNIGVDLSVNESFKVVGTANNDGVYIVKSIIDSDNITVSSKVVNESAIVADVTKAFN